MAERQGSSTLLGVRWPPEKVYHTCTFQGLGPRKGEFLERVVQAMEARGFRKTAPIKPFHLSLGWKWLLCFWSLSKDEVYERHSIAGSDILLINEKNEPMAIRAEERNKDLRFGYIPYWYISTHKRREWLLSVYPGMVFTACYILSLIVGFIIFLTVVNSLSPLWSGLLWIAITVLILSTTALPILHYYTRIIPQREQKEIDQIVVKVAESLGGKQITPFKKTTVELED